jgi:hypothetical protein
MFALPLWLQSEGRGTSAVIASGAKQSSAAPGEKRWNWIASSLRSSQ